MHGDRLPLPDYDYAKGTKREFQELPAEAESLPAEFSRRKVSGSATGFRGKRRIATCQDSQWATGRGVVPVQNVP
jgi:hypothetical protein